MFLRSRERLDTQDSHAIRTSPPPDCYCHTLLYYNVLHYTVTALLYYTTLYCYCFTILYYILLRLKLKLRLYRCCSRWPVYGASLVVYIIIYFIDLLVSGD